MKKQNIEDIFSSIENFSSVPPPELWDNIEEKLHPRKKKKATIIWWALAASLMIGLSIPSVLYFNSNTQDSNPLQNNSVVQEKNSNPDKNNTISTSKNNSEKNIKLNKVQEPAIVSSEAENSAQSKNENNNLNQNTVSNNTSNQNADLKAKTHSKQNAVVNVASIQGKNSKVKTYHIQNSNSNQYSNTNSYIDENVISKKGVTNDATIVSNSKSKEDVNLSAEKETLNNNPVIVSNAISKNNKNTISQYETEPKSNTKNDVSLTEKRVVIDSKNGSPESLIKDKAVANNSKNNTKSDVSPTGKAVVIDSKNGSSENLIKDKAVANNSKNNTKSDVSPTGKAVIIDSKNGSSENLIKDKAVADNSKNNTKSDVSPTGKAVVIDSKNGSSENLIKDKAVTYNSKNNTKSDISPTEKAVVIDSKNGSPENLIKDKAVANNSKNNTKSDVSPTGKAVVIDSKNGSSESLIKDKAVADNSKNNTKSDVSPTGKVVVIDSKNGSSENLIKDKTVASNSKSDVLLTGQDSIQLAVLQNLEKTIAEGKSKKEEEPKSAVPSTEKWSLEVFAGVANSENLKKEKTLGNVNGSKQTNAYGVKTNYKLNKKWTVSSGVKINELGQSIADVSYMDTSNTSGLLSSSDYLIKNVTTVSQITNNSNYVFVTTNAKNSLKSDNFQTGNIDQSLKYIEIPLEVSYALFNRNKTSISLNTGGVVGKLISNNLYLNGTSIGSNSDANDFIYGSLLSSTLQYRIYKKTHIFVEPGMNYYINPLNNQSFNQFQWAFNFGLNVSF